MFDYPKMIDVELVDENAIKPIRGTGTSSGLDVFIPKDFGHTILKSGNDILIDLKIIFDTPVGWDFSVYNKSGIATKKKLIKGAELIDSDYRGHIKLHLFNIGKEAILLKPAMKIAQLVLRPVWLGQLNVVDKIDTNTERGEGGFGSTNTNKDS